MDKKVNSLYVFDALASAYGLAQLLDMEESVRFGYGKPKESVLTTKLKRAIAEMGGDIDDLPQVFSLPEWLEANGYKKSG